jgi:hypothetical protein
VTHFHDYEEVAEENIHRMRSLAEVPSVQFLVAHDMVWYACIYSNEGQEVAENFHYVRRSHLACCYGFTQHDKILTTLINECYKRYLKPLGNPRACSLVLAASLHRKRCLLNNQNITIDMVLVKMHKPYELTYEGPHRDGQKYLRSVSDTKVRERCGLTMNQCSQVMTWH